MRYLLLSVMLCLFIRHAAANREECEKLKLGIRDHLAKYGNKDFWSKLVKENEADFIAADFNGTTIENWENGKSMINQYRHVEQLYNKLPGIAKDTVKIKTIYNMDHVKSLVEMAKPRLGLTNDREFAEIIIRGRDEGKTLSRWAHGDLIPYEGQLVLNFTAQHLALDTAIEADDIIGIHLEVIDTLKEIFAAEGLVPPNLEREADKIFAPLPKRYRLDDGLGGASWNPI